MKFIILLVVTFCVMAGVKAQSHVKSFNDCGSMRNSEVYKGDTVIIRCDSVILLTKQKFKTYQNSNRTYAEIVRTYDNYVEVLEQRSDQQNKEYKKLKQLNDSLIHVSGEYVDSIDGKVSDLKTGLSQTLNNLQSIKTDVSSLKDDVNKVGKLSKLKSKLLWGGSGVIIGIIIGRLL
jgi:hypothetical protein